MKYKIPENAKIIKVEDAFSEKLGYEGLRILTDKGEVKILISDEQQCCERWGSEFLETPDDTSKVIGAVLLSVEDLTIASPRDTDDEAIETQLRITTSKGIIQYAVYNSHNGYYSHATFLQVFDTIEEGSI